MSETRDGNSKLRRLRCESLEKRVLLSGVLPIPTSLVEVPSLEVDPAEARQPSGANQVDSSGEWAEDSHIERQLRHSRAASKWSQAILAFVAENTRPIAADKLTPQSSRPPLAGTVEYCRVFDHIMEQMCLGDSRDS